MEPLLTAKELHDVSNRAGDVGNHDSYQHQTDHVPEPCAKGKDEEQHEEGSDKSRHGHAECVPQRECAADAASKQYDEGHAEAGTTADAQQ